MITTAIFLKDGTVIESDFEAGPTIQYVDRLIRLKTGNSDINILAPDGSQLAVKSEQVEKIELKF